MKLCITLTILMVFSCLDVFAEADRRVIFAVNNVGLNISDIMPTRDTVKTWYKNHKGEYGSEEEVKVELQKRNAINAINDILLSLAYERYGIKVTEEEVHKAIADHYFKGKDPERQIEKEAQGWQALIMALRLVQKNPDKEEQIYQQYVKEHAGYDYETWKSVRLRFDTNEKIKALEASVPTKPEDVINDCRQMMTELLMRRELEDRILEEALEEKNKANSAVKQTPRSTSDPKIHEAEPAPEAPRARQRKQILSNWWKGEYRSIRLVLKNPSYEYLFDEVSDYFRQAGQPEDRIKSLRAE